MVNHKTNFKINKLSLIKIDSGLRRNDRFNGHFQEKGILQRPQAV